MADMRACFCSLCSGGVLGGSSLVPRSTWFVHQRQQSNRGARSWRRSAADGIPPAATVAPASAAVAAAAADPSLSTDHTENDGHGDVGGPDGGAAAEDDVQVAPAPETVTVRPNGVCIPLQVFKENIDDLVAYNFVVQQCLTQEETDDYLLQRHTNGERQTPHALNSMIGSSVDLYTKKVDCCSAGCVAFTAERKSIRSVMFARLPGTAPTTSRASRRPTGHAFPGPR